MPKKLFGYDVLDHIGQGAGSQIYVVSQPETGRRFALKHVVCKTDKDQRFVEQLHAEYEVGRHVADPGLRKSIDYKAHKTFLRRTTEAALILELFDGSPLENHRPESVRQTVGIFIRTAKALEALHRAGYVHCDLKPNNILVDGRGEVKVIDLGQTCRTGTAKTRIQGTPDFIAPEQVRCEDVTAKTDVYNYGATMYWTLTGKHVPTLFTIRKGENSILADSLVDPPAKLNPRCPETLSNVVMECTRARAEKRPDMHEVARRLEVILYALNKVADLQAAGAATAAPARIAQQQVGMQQAAQRMAAQHGTRPGVAV